MAVRTSSVLRSCQLFARQSPPSLISLRLPAPSPLALSRSFSSHTSSTPSSTRRTFSSTPVSSYAAPSDSQVNSVEDPYQDEASRSPDLETKVKDLYAILDSVGTSMLTTRAPDSEELHSRAMYPASKEGLIFSYIANADSGKFDGIAHDQHVNISYWHSDNSWVSVAGRAQISDDREKIKKNFSPATKAWFQDLQDGVHTGDENDPRVQLIEVTPIEIRYFIQQKGAISKVVDMAASAVSGKTAKPGDLRVLSGSELEQAKRLATH